MISQSAGSTSPFAAALVARVQYHRPFRIDLIQRNLCLKGLMKDLDRAEVRIAFGIAFGQINARNPCFAAGSAENHFIAIQVIARCDPETGDDGVLVDCMYAQAKGLVGRQEAWFLAAKREEVSLCHRGKAQQEH